MSEITCVELADRLPGWAAERLSPEEARAVAEHVASCVDCAGQVAVIRAVRAGRPSAPAGLAERIGTVIRDAEPAPRPAPVRCAWAAWATSAAAVLLLALGTFVLRDGATDPPADLGEVALEESVWIAEDGIVAGAPLLDQLPEDVLALLLEEIGE